MAEKWTETAERLSTRAAQNRASVRASLESAGPAPGVDAVATGSPAGAGRTPPKPLMCRLADLMKEWRQTRDNMKARGEDDAAIAVECCMETLHEDVTNFIKEMKEYREHCAKQENGAYQPAGGDITSTTKQNEL